MANEEDSIHLEGAFLKLGIKAMLTKSFHHMNKVSNVILGVFLSISGCR